MKELKPCGTYGGYQRHLRRGETTCDKCRAAAAEYHSAYRKSSPERAAASRKSGLVANRALYRLRDLHYAEYTALLAEERSR